ncbi:phage major capsid protein [Lentilactobacillus senioris]|uniref:phage major capsid protein n=1 Tax=Lentilactobacillus senioris TaxID=931534 RepID=UPI003D269849
MGTNLEKLLLDDSEVRANEPKDDKEDTGKKSDDTQQDNENEPKDDPKQDTSISGYALKFNAPSKDLGGFIEIIDPNALADTDLSKVVLLFNHNYDNILASVANNNLTLAIDETGLKFDARLDTSVSYIADAYKQIQNGNLSHCSFSFDVADNGDEFTTDNDGKTVRTVKQISNLYDVSVVSIAAYDETEVSTAARSYENYLTKKESEGKHMPIETLDPNKETKQAELRSFDNYIRSRGEKRDGLTTDGANIVIPELVAQPVIEELSKQDLAKYSYGLNVSSTMGKVPVISDSQAVLATKEELAAIPETESGIDGVKYEVKTRTGKIILSNEILDDSAVDLSSIVSDQLKRLVLNTNNAQILTILSGLTATPVTTMDDIIKAYDGKLDPNFKEIAVTNMSGLSYLDTLKYEDGHFMLMDDLTSPSGKAIFGLPLLVLNDKFLPGTPLFIGSLREAVAVITRNNIELKYDLYDDFGTAFAAILRTDYQLLNPDAMLNLTLPAGTAATKASTKK